MQNIIKINKKAENSGMKKLLNLIIILLVIAIIVFSIVYLKLPDKIKDLLPDWGNPDPKNNTNPTNNLPSIIKMQEQTPYKEKSLTCPSPYKDIYLEYWGSYPDVFRFRFNKKLGRPQIIPMINGDYYSTKEWLISPNILDNFERTKKIHKDEKSHIEYIMEARTEENFVERILEIYCLWGYQGYYGIYFREGFPYLSASHSTKKCTPEGLILDSEKKRILEKLNDPELQIEYERRIKIAPEECKEDIYLTSIDDATPEWTIESAILELKNRGPDSKYSKNREFINDLFLNHLLTEEEWNDIRGKGLFDTQENIKHVLNLLEENLIKWQEFVGLKILEIIETKNTNQYNENVSKDTGAKSFECLILQQALTESNLKHCIYNANYLDNPLYCSTTQNIHRVLKSWGDEESYGVMQINTNVHDKVDVINFQENVEYGINLLIDHYRDKLQNYPGGQDYCGKHYGGWELALRYYNGWAPNNCDSGNPNYVEDVKEKRVDIMNLFSECKYGY